MLERWLWQQIGNKLKGSKNRKQQWIQRGGCWIICYKPLFDWITRTKTAGSNIFFLRTLVSLTFIFSCYHFFHSFLWIPMDSLNFSTPFLLPPLCPLDSKSTPSYFPWFFFSSHFYLSKNYFIILHSLSLCEFLKEKIDHYSWQTSSNHLVCGFLLY